MRAAGSALFGCVCVVPLASGTGAAVSCCVVLEMFSYMILHSKSPLRRHLPSGRTLMSALTRTGTFYYTDMVHQSCTCTEMITIWPLTLMSRTESCTMFAPCSEHVLASVWVAYSPYAGLIHVTCLTPGAHI